MRELLRAVEREQARLNQLDAIAGDGDHGATVVMGLRAVVASLPADPDAHHDLARFHWHLGTPGDEPLAIGFDVIELDGGRIAKVHGFLDKVPG